MSTIIPTWQHTRSRHRGPVGKQCRGMRLLIGMEGCLGTEAAAWLAVCELQAAAVPRFGVGVVWSLELFGLWRS